MFIIHLSLKVFAVIQHSFDEEAVLFDIEVLTAYNLSQKEYLGNVITGLSLNSRCAWVAHDSSSLMLHGVHLSVTRLMVFHLNLNFEIIIVN